MRKFFIYYLFDVDELSVNLLEYGYVSEIIRNRYYYDHSCIRRKLQVTILEVHI